MTSLKQLILAPVFVISSFWMFTQISLFLNSDNNLFSLDLKAFYLMLTLLVSILVTTLLFALFTTLAQDLKMVLPAALLSSLSPLIFFPLNQALAMLAVSLLLFTVGFFYLNRLMQTYLDFRPTTLLIPPIKHLGTFFLLLIAAVYFFNIRVSIKEKGFQLPDSLVDPVIKSLSPQIPEPTSFLPDIDLNQLELIKDNPLALQQAGIDPSLVQNILNKPEPTNPNALLKTAIKQQVDNVLAPYLNIIPPVMTLLLFLTLKSLLSLLSLTLAPLIWLIFYILEKSNFISFKKEMREVRKMEVS